jgi:DNA-binding NarL/FixJ family response regulator
MRGVPRTVLIVDDSAPFRTTARAVLVARGYAIAGMAADGAEALDAARTLRPDAVLLDVNLPDVDGVTVAGELTRHGAAPAVVLVSTVERAALGGRVEASGARGFLAKSELASSRLVDLLGPPDG